MDITGLPALDFAIGLSFVFLLLSVFASAIQEYIAGLLKLRSKTLLRGLGNMLEGKDDPKKPAQKGTTPTSGTPGENLTAHIYEHPLIRSFYKKGRGLFRSTEDRLPSYIAPRSFALALLGTLAPGAVATGADGKAVDDHDVIKALRESIDKAGLPADTKTLLLGLLDDARGDIDRFRASLEAWFDDTMARVSGWYKRQSQLILVVIGLAIALALNANTLTIGERLWKDTAVRAAVVQQASGATGGNAPSPKTPSQAAGEIDKVVQLGIPMGWTSNAGDPRYVARSGHQWFARLLYHHVLGWLLTVVAISLGAPFWFDTLSRFSRLRNSGKPEKPLPASAYGKAGERVESPA
jgi:hypothetical protein